MDHSMSDHAEMSEIYMFIICDAGLIYKGGLYSSCIMGDAKQEGADSMSIEKAKAYLEEKRLPQRWRMLPGLWALHRA